MQRPVAIIGAPLDLGQERRGVDMGPSAIRYAGLEERLARIGLDVSDRGNVRTPEPEAPRSPTSAHVTSPEILAACTELAGARRGGRARGRPPLVLGGDHSIAIGTLAGLAAAPGAPGGVIWIDAHGDLNTPRRARRGTCTGCRSRRPSASPPVVHPRGLTLPAVEPARVVLVGTRSLDTFERAFLHEPGSASSR